MIVVHTLLETKPSKFQLFILYYIEHFQPMLISQDGPYLLQIVLFSPNQHCKASLFSSVSVCVVS